MPSFFKSLLLFAFLGSWRARAFNFTIQPEELTPCGEIEVQWEGGEPPFRLLVVPVDHYMANISIPSTSYNTETRIGSFRYQVPFAERHSILFAMSDSTGISAGGVTGIMRVSGQVESPPAGCQIEGPNDGDYTFGVEDGADLRQCSTFGFTYYSQAVKPIKIVGFVPGNFVFEASAPDLADTFSWFNPYPTGTNIIFTMVDAANRNGGVLMVQTVDSSPDSSCLSKDPPPNLAPSNSSQIPVPTNDLVSPAPQQQQSGPRIDIIVGAAIGGVGLIVLVVVAILLFKKRQQKRQSNVFIPVATEETEFGVVGPTHFNYAGHPYPFASNSSHTTDGKGRNHLGAEHQQPRIVVHQDMEDSPLIELPPMYVESRSPPTGFPPPPGFYEQQSGSSAGPSTSTSSSTSFPRDRKR
ncbi:hypothetical protein FA15DRAFT_664058 [Coprinopsis marcescibilis]|uniref:Mid2 domain-containing protein n=1 Tax=Coprinopsis marcescibilis TaxID=230819 RepID=A0A5C3L905_COPMA|nr:hypothetical protein FA15DRAFT_664058 [Coprinopsis marcescibilis]